MKVFSVVEFQFFRSGSELDILVQDVFLYGEVRHSTPASHFWSRFLLGKHEGIC